MSGAGIGCVAEGQRPNAVSHQATSQSCLVEDEATGRQAQALVRNFLQHW
jgi:hypothetical protein